MRKFDDTLDDNSYEIINELQIRKMLEEKTDWRFEFTKQTKYGYDLELYRWPDDSDKPDDRELIGYFELERADDKRKKSWVTGPVPTEDWSFYSILKRKLYDWEYAPGVCSKPKCTHRNVEWGDPKPESHRAIFVKFNHDLSNCFAVPIPTVVKDGVETRYSVECDPRNSYRKLDLDHESVKTGIEDVVGFIDGFLNQRQTSMREY